MLAASAPFPRSILLAVAWIGGLWLVSRPPAPQPPTIVYESFMPPPAYSVAMPDPVPVASARPIYAAVYDAVYNGQDLYWIGTDGVWKSDGTTHTSILLDGGYTLTVDGDRVFSTDINGKAIHRFDDSGDHIIAKLPTEPLELKVSGGYVYFTAWGRRTAQRVSVDGGAIETLGAGAASDPIAADGEHLYVASVSSGKVLRVDGKKVTTLATGLKGAQEIVVDGDHLYIADANRVLRLPITGGKLEVIATGGDAARLTKGDGTIYWTTWGDWERSTPACPGNMGVVHDLMTMNVVAEGCDVRGMAKGGHYVLGMQQLTPLH